MAIALNRSQAIAFLGIATMILASSCQYWGPCGELACPTTEWEADLLGVNHVPPTTSSGAARGEFRLNPSGYITYRISVTALPASSITTATLHRGAIGVNSDSVVIGLCGTGGVNVPACATLAAPGDLAAGTFAVTPAQLNSLRTFAMYANVRTVGNPSGELRGQLRNVN